jgi:hypothetical protein
MLTILLHKTGIRLARDMMLSDHTPKGHIGDMKWAPRQTKVFTYKPTFKEWLFGMRVVVVIPGDVNASN